MEAATVKKAVKDLEISGGEKDYMVNSNKMKGKKIAVPGEKDKVKIPSSLKLQVGQQAIKMIDGNVVLRSLLLHKIASWESDDKAIKLVIMGEGNKQEELEFGTKQGADICQDIFTYAQQLAKVKKIDRQKAQKLAKEEEAWAAQKSEEEQALSKAQAVEQKATTEAAAAEEKAKADEAAAALSQAIEAVIQEKQTVLYQVEQKFWTGPGKLIDSKKVAESLTLKISSSQITIEDPGNGTSISPWQVDSILIHNIVSWKRLKNTMTISVCKGALNSFPDFEGQMDFITEDGPIITAVLFQVAAELAKAKKAEKAEKRRREKEEADAKAQEEAELVARQAMQLEDTVAELYLDTLRQFKVNDLLRGPYAAFDGASSAPGESDMQKIDASKVAASCSSAKDASLIADLKQLAWSNCCLSDAEALVVFGAIQSESAQSNGSSADLAEAASVALINIIGENHATCDLVTEKGAVALAIGWLTNHSGSIPTCRCALALLATLFRGDGTTSKEESIKAGVVTTLLDLVKLHMPEADSEPVESRTVTFGNPKFVPIADVLEKALHCLAMVTVFSPVARQQVVDANGDSTVLSLLKRIQTPMLISCVFSGIIGSLVDTRNVYNEDDEGNIDKAFEIARRLAKFSDIDLVDSLITVMDYSMTDVTLGSVASLLLRMLKSEHKDIVAEFLFATDDNALMPAQKLVDALHRTVSDSRSEGLAVSLLMFAIGHLASCSAEYKEQIIGMGALKAAITGMSTYQKSRMVQESSLLFIHMLISNLPNDVHEMLPQYMGISMEEIIAEDFGSEQQYKVLRKAVLRAESDIDSEGLGSIMNGTVVSVSDRMVNHLGQTRVKCTVPYSLKYPKERIGWTSVETVDGTPLLQLMPGAHDAEKLEEKTKAVMTGFFKPLNVFSDDDSIAAATVHAAKTICARNESLKSAVVESGKPIKWMIKAMVNHSNHADMALSACDTISCLVVGNRRHQKKFRNTDLPEALATVLDLHSDNQAVMLSAFGCMKVMTSLGEKSSDFFASKMADKDGLALVDNVLKEHKGANKDILDLGLGLRAKISKFVPEAAAPDPAQNRLGAGRRASLSVFALPQASPGKGIGDTMPALAEEQEGDEEEDAYAQLTRDLMNDMFSVKQNHIRKAPKTVQLQVGSMGLTFYNKDMKPLQNIMYMNLNSWTATEKSVELFEKTGKKNASKKTVLQVPGDDAQSIVNLMETKASELAAQHKMKRKFAVRQTHLSDAAAELSLQISDKAILLYDSDEKIVEELLLSSITETEKVVDEGGKVLLLTQKKTDLEIHVQIRLGTEKADTIIKLLNERQAELTKAAEDAALAAEAAVKTETGAEAVESEPEQEPESNSGVEEGVPPLAESQDAGVEQEGGETKEERDEENSEDEEGEQEEEEDVAEEELPPLDEFTVIQDHARGSKVVELHVMPTGLMLTDKGDSILYAYANLQSWTASSSHCKVYVSAQVGLVTGVTFKTTEAAQICARLQNYGCEAARRHVLSLLPGSTVKSPYVGGMADAELAAKLALLQEENRKLAEARAAEAGVGAAGGGGAVHAEMAAALKAAQAELQSVKKKLDAARAASTRQEKNEAQEVSIETDRIVDLEQLAAKQAKELGLVQTELAGAKAAGAAEAQDRVQKLKADAESWRRKAEAADALVASMQNGDGAAALKAMSDEKEKLAEKVEKLTNNGKAAMVKLGELTKSDKASKSEMEKMKKQRQKETAVVKRAMAELKSLRGAVSKKEKEVKMRDDKMKKMATMFKTMKEKHATELEAAKLRSA